MGATEFLNYFAAAGLDYAALDSRLRYVSMGSTMMPFGDWQAKLRWVRLHIAAQPADTRPNLVVKLDTLGSVRRGRRLERLRFHGQPPTAAESDLRIPAPPPSSCCITRARIRATWLTRCQVQPR